MDKQAYPPVHKEEINVFNDILKLNPPLTHSILPILSQHCLQVVPPNEFSYSTEFCFCFKPQISSWQNQNPYHGL